MLTQLRRGARTVLSGNPAAILLYHRVATLEVDPQQLAVSPQHFDEHLQVLRRQFDPVPLRDVRASRLSRRRLMAAVTFDDGYADNLLEGKALLEKHSVPATVFVASGAVGSDREFWWDEIERAILHDLPLPEVLELTIGDHTRRWVMPADGDGHRGRTLAARDGSARGGLYAELCELVRPLSIGAREAVLEQLRNWAGIPAAARESHRPLTDSELRQLADGQLIEIGAHTVTHPLLARMAVEQQQTEVTESKRALEQLINRPVRSFSYPFGTRSDYDARTVGVVKDAGFERACSNFPDRLTTRTPAWELPRLLVRDWDGDTFARNLHMAFE